MITRFSGVTAATCLLPLVPSCGPSAETKAIVAAGFEREAQERRDLRESVQQAAANGKAFADEIRRDCASPNLRAAREAVSRASQIVGAVQFEAPTRMTVGGAMLNVADIAKRKGCPEVARAIYDEVVANFVGALMPRCASALLSASRIFARVN